MRTPKNANAKSDVVVADVVKNTSVVETPKEQIMTTANEIAPVAVAVAVPTDYKLTEAQGKTVLSMFARTSEKVASVYGIVNGTIDALRDMLDATALEAVTKASFAKQGLTGEFDADVRNAVRKLSQTMQLGSDKVNIADLLEVAEIATADKNELFMDALSALNASDEMQSILSGLNKMVGRYTALCEQYNIACVYSINPLIGIDAKIGRRGQSGRTRPNASAPINAGSKRELKHNTRFSGKVNGFLWDVVTDDSQYTMHICARETENVAVIVSGPLASAPNAKCTVNDVAANGMSEIDYVSFSSFLNGYIREQGNSKTNYNVAQLMGMKQDSNWRDMVYENANEIAAFV